MKIAVAYVLVGLVLAVIGGSVISKAKMESYVEPFVYNNQAMDIAQEEMTRKDRIDFGKMQVKDIVNKVWLYILIGVGIGALIHNWIPEEVISAVLGQDIQRADRWGLQAGAAGSCAHL